MSNKKTLSIVIVTMNRKEQLLEALQSCINCNKPDDTEYIIIDNASIDATGDAVESFFKNKKYFYTYKRLPENKGAGGGRSEGFNLAQGNYVYFLDDDAVIDDDCMDIFFIKSIEILNNNPNIATLTTRIWDEKLQYNRPVTISNQSKVNGYDTIFMLLGGSHFIRKSALDNPLYPDYTYGYEELYPSLCALDKGLYNLYFPAISITHKPKINKWAKGSVYKREVVCRENAGLLASKYLLYPTIFRPLLFAAFLARWFVHIRKYKGGLKESFTIYKEQTKGIKVRKIKFKTVIRIFREFRFGVGV